MRQSAAEIEETAVRWVWLLDREGRTPELEAELAAWLAADTRHRGAMLQAEATWMMLARGSQLAPVDEAAVANDAPPVRQRLSRRAFAGLGVAFAACAATVLVLLQPDARYDTGVGEIRRVQLVDGSSALINTSSALDFDAGSNRRRVRLGEGEAWFKVAKDRARPFVVEAGAVRVQAVGTAFSVRRRANGADVLVTEGVVESWVVGAEGHRVRIRAGERAFVADNAAIDSRPANPAEIDRMLAWRNGKIDLNGETLGWAAAEFNRYNRRQQIVVDPSIADERLYGVFRIDDPAAFVTAVEMSLGAGPARDGSPAIALAERG